MSLEQLPKLQALIDEDWDLTVTAHHNGKYHAVVHLGRMDSPRSHHYLGKSVAEAITALERYVDEHEAATATAPTRADQWTPEQIASFNDHTVQCRCGWWGKVSALLPLPGMKLGCPECRAQFNPATEKLAPMEPGKPL